MNRCGDLSLATLRRVRTAPWRPGSFCLVRYVTHPTFPGQRSLLAAESRIVRNLLVTTSGSFTAVKRDRGV
jgi:hypothetical protein